MQKRKLLLLLIYIIAALAILDSLYLTYVHYADTSSEWCSFGASFDCGILNKGEFSTVDGFINHLLGTYFNIPIPNSFLSLALFLYLILALATKSLFGIPKRQHLNALIYLLIAGILYALFLIYIEAFVIFLWCILCILILAALALLLLLKKDPELF